MSGVVALLDRADDVDSDVFGGMLERLAHRGLDGAGRWSDGRVALGHQFRRTTPEARPGDQPHSAGERVLVADVRLDNRGALLDALSMSANDGPVPDSRLLLAAYREWGSECVEHLVGAFAFAVWDPVTGRLFCARDHLGVKPLYYAETDDAFAAASEPGPLFALRGVSQRPNERRVGDYLVGRYGTEAETFHADVSRLPPGHAMTVSDDGVDVRRYWSLDDVEPFARDADVDYEQRFRELFTEAVRCRLRTPGPAGSFLSGGIDSSSIASVASGLRERRGESPLHTFSAVFEALPECDEREYIEAVLDAGRFEPHFVRGDRVDPLADVDRYVRHVGAPYYPSLVMLILHLYEEIRRAGVDVVLHGYGGDQTMGSDVRGYFRGLARRGELSTLARELQGYHERYPWRSRRDVLREDVLEPLAPTTLRRLKRRVAPADPVGAAFAPIDRTFAERSGLDARLRAATLQRPPNSQHALVRDALTNGEPSFNLELNDVASALHGVEPRYPYFDVRLVEFAVALPSDETVDRGLDRPLVRNGLADVLPGAVRERAGKAEFSANVRHGTRAYALDAIEATLFDGSSAPATARYLDAPALRTSFDRLRGDDGDVFDARGLLMATTLERWLTDHASPTG